MLHSSGGRPPNPRGVLLAEVAQATQRLADAGVPSPRFDAEELAAYVHGVKRGELHRVADSDFDARY
ncbi:MAG: peptide chain release factor N(5)-glutamine methyltransferase, partial [Streptomyces sp.]